MPGSVEDAVRRDLEELPVSMRTGGVAAVALMAAVAIDEGGLAPRDAATFFREVRLALAQLREGMTGEVRGDVTDEIRARREKRLAGS